ncbi:MAG: YggT family protein [Sporichthyaceae bacterium]
MTVVGAFVYYPLFIFLLLLLARLVMEYVFLFARSYEPKGAVVIVLELVYSVTDPPLKFLRRFIPPLRLGGVSLDLSFLVLFVIVTIGLQVARTL